MTFEIPCLECGGSGFFGGNGPTVERKCEACNGTGVLVEDGLVNVRPVPKSVFASMTRSETRTLFNQMEERRMHREGFGI
jgi:DnaJ-class molecular chaperone